MLGIQPPEAVNSVNVSNFISQAPTFAALPTRQKFFRCGEGYFLSGCPAGVLPLTPLVIFVSKKSDLSNIVVG